jgi:hypothetical protein
MVICRPPMVLEACDPTQWCLSLDTSQNLAARNRVGAFGMIGSEALTALADLQSPERRKHLGSRLRNLLKVVVPASSIWIATFPRQHQQVPDNHFKAIRGSIQAGLSVFGSVLCPQPATYIVKFARSGHCHYRALYNEHGFFNGRHPELCTRCTQYGGSQQAQHIHPQGGHPECHQTVRPWPLTPCPFTRVQGKPACNILLTLLVFL